MHLSYKKKIFLYFLLVFAVFSAIVVMIQQNRERQYKNARLATHLNTYTEVLSSYIREHRLYAERRMEGLREMLPLLPAELRISVIDRNGNVLFDNEIDGNHPIENHLNRPEIRQALAQEDGVQIRRSETTGNDFYYFARYFDPYFIRVALPYTDDVRNILKADDIFIYFMLLLFFTALISVLYLADRFGKAISGLNDFLISAENHHPDYDKIRFPETELGEIGGKIVNSYKLLEDSRNKIKMEQEKLIRHFHHSDEGICIFAADHTKIYTNTHFIQLLNTILDEPTFQVEDLFKAGEFREMARFLQQQTPLRTQGGPLPVWEDKISKNGKFFVVKLLVFHDNSYEIILSDISSVEKNRLLKQEMTNNIAHELKTPVSSIRGYIETILAQETMDPARQKIFLERAYSQTIRLSDLIRDIALITKMEEASELFGKEAVNLRDIAEEVVSDLEIPLRQNRMTVRDQLPETLPMKGNPVLLYSIFRNLVDNSIAYAGEAVEIGIVCYAEDEEYYYLTFYDTGQGMEVSHLDRIFDRFYRVNAGRSRKTGGSGLGLSIVKNAVLFHKGLISAKNRKEGGLEFVFSLRKN